MRLPQLDDLFQAKYRLRAELGRGGFATVFLAVDERAARNVAIKVIDPGEFGYSAGMQERFMREVRVLSSLRDPHTITMFDYGQTEAGLLFMVFEYVEGEDLEELIERVGALHEREAFHVVHQVLQSLREAHGFGLLHRDIKPANIRIFEYMEDTRRVKLLDFGIARAASPGDAKITRDGAMVGTPKYMAPEQVYGDDPTPASDIYSLGLVAYEMLTGRAAVTGGSTADVLRRQASLAPIVLPPQASVSPALRAVVEKMVVKHPAGRYQSASEVLDALQAAQTTLGMPGASGYATPVPSGAIHTPASSHAVHTPALGTAPAAERVPAGLSRAEQSSAGHPSGQLGATGSTRSGENRERAPGSMDHPGRRETRLLVGGVLLLLAALAFAGATAFVLQADADEEVSPGADGPAAATVAPAFDRDAASETVRIIELASLEVGLAVTLASKVQGDVRVGCGGTARGGDSTISISFEGRTREVALYAPRGYNSQRQYPVVLLYHDNREQVVGQFLRATRFAELAESEPMIVVSPQAFESNPKMADPPVPWRDPEHEIRFAERLLEELGGLYCIDRARVYAVGHGTGGEMVEKLRCGMPLSATAITSEHLVRGQKPCETTPPVPLIEFWGESDRYNPKAGGKPLDCPARAVRLSTRDHQDAWRRANGCGPTAKLHAKTQDFSCQTWSRCEAPFVSCTHRYGSGWRGTTYTGLETFVSSCFGPSAPFDIARPIWEFFETEGRRIEPPRAPER